MTRETIGFLVLLFTALGVAVALANLLVPHIS
jgi:hypothetical protein